MRTCLRLLILLALLPSCSEKGDQARLSEESAQSKAIVGNWRSDLIDEGRRDKFIEITFTGDGRVTDYSVKLTNSDSGELSGTSPVEGTYQLSDGFIHWDIEGSKAKIPYRIEDSTMHLTLGQDNVTFRRRASQGDVPKP